MRDFFVSWRENLMFPLVVAAMMGCIFHALVQVLEIFIPGSRQFDYLTWLAILAALLAIYSYRSIRVKKLRGSDATKWRIAQVVLLYVLLRVGNFASAIAAGEAASFSLISITLEFVATFISIMLVWGVATKTAMEFERLYQPPEDDFEYVKTERIYVSPYTNLTRQFFGGGVLVVLLAGIVQAGLAEALVSTGTPEAVVEYVLNGRNSVTGVVPGVLLYFLLGLLLMSQIQFATVRRLWEAKDIEIPSALGNVWVRYSLIFLGLGIFITLLLPTNYAFSLYEVVNFALVYVGRIVGYIAALVLSLISLPFLFLAWLFSLLFGEDEAGTPPSMPDIALPTPPPVLPDPEIVTETSSWWLLAQSIAFWLVTVAVIVYVIRTYLRDNPEIMAAIRSFRVVEMLRNMWLALKQQFGGATQAVRQRVSVEAIREWMNQVRPTQILSRPISGRQSPRERIRQYYLDLLDTARGRGFNRQKTQTPYEYKSILDPNFPQVQPEIEAVTEAFMEARYSAHDMTDEQVQQVNQQADTVKSELRRET